MSEQYCVKKIDNPIDWTVEVPGSKSMTNRALLMAALTDGKVELDGVLFSDDSRHFLSCLKSLGFEVEINEQEKHVTVTGADGRIPAEQAEINVGSAGTAARFLTAMLGFSDGVYTIQASEQMKKRPMDTLFELLTAAGAQITYLEKEGHLPVCIRGCAYHPKMVMPGAQKGNWAKIYDGSFGEKNAKPEEQAQKIPLELEVDISKSTQFLSALLLISPMIKQGLHIHITSEKKDGAYIRITRKMLEEAGVGVEFDGESYQVPSGASYLKRDYQIEPDVSAACYFYAAAAVTGGSAQVKHVHWDNSQGDLKFLHVLEQMGCRVEEKEDGIAVTGPENGRLSGVTVNMNDFSDQALTLAAIAPFAAEKVRIEGIGHIRLQECDRLHAMANELSKLGILCAEEKAAITIYPGKPKPGLVETYEDHRVAMAFSLIGLKATGIVIDNPGCCRKTFEEYFHILDALTEKSES